MSLLTAPIVKGSHVLARYCFIFFKKRPRPSKSSYQVRQILALFCNLVASILGENCVIGLKVNKIVIIRSATRWAIRIYHVYY